MLDTWVIRGAECELLARAAEDAVWFSAPWPRTPSGIDKAARFVVDFDRKQFPRIKLDESGKAELPAGHPDQSLCRIAAKLRDGDADAVDRYFRDSSSFSARFVVARNIWMQVISALRFGGARANIAAVWESVPPGWISARNDAIPLVEKVTAQLETVRPVSALTHLAKDNQLRNDLASLIELIGNAEDSEGQHRNPG